MSFQKNIQQKREAVDRFIAGDALKDFPKNLIEPVQHILNLKGKRLRPVMVMLAAESYGLSQEESISTGAALEVFHNFTLVHDDIMDNAKLRRGTITVHEKYGIERAIVTGDAMYPLAIGLLIQGHEDKTKLIMNVFNKMAKGVMEGQQFDMDFEEMKEISLDDYMNMIRLKTSVLFGAACELGAIIGGASEDDRNLFYQFGLNTGLAFQMMDDYLDTFGDSDFGKTIGGDILRNKKTFLLVTAMQNANPKQKKQIKALLEEEQEEKKVAGFINLYLEMNIAQICLDKMETFHQQASNALKSTTLPKESTNVLIQLSELMLKRRK
jgi:geranylgeranyl diphosphate synthase type II